jgi:23S rRNA (cytosine1962-C5)-methyltransferase
MSYQLLDSGEGERLEQFGTLTITRPCRTAVWKKRYPTLWKEADATFHPERRWRTKNGTPSEWDVTINNVAITLRLQENGQVGLFPEHVSYLEQYLSELTPQSKVLNLFAYTGFATAACASRSAVVTHVDISKSCISWARHNLETSRISSEKVRYIQDDAIKFSEKELARGNTYDLIIADPPSFSRISKNKQWDVDDIIRGLISTLTSLLASGGRIILTSHRAELCDSVLFNLLLEQVSQAHECSRSALTLLHAHDDRVLPAGYFATMKRTDY